MQTDERKEFARRLNLALDAIGFPRKGMGRQVALARKFGVSQKGARKWVEGESMPDTKRIPGIAMELGVRTEWLLSGIGPMREETLYEQPLMLRDSGSLYTLTLDEQRLVERYRRLTREDRKKLLAASAALVQMLEMLEAG